MNFEQKQKFYNISPKTSEHIMVVVMNRVQHVKIVRTRIKGAIHGSITLVACLGLVPAIQYFVTEASHSGFTQYLSLAVSDSAAMFNNWKAFSLSIAESAPIVGSITCLVVLAVITYSGRRSFEYVSQARSSLYA